MTSASHPERRYSLLPGRALGLVVDAFVHGATKHGAGDWADKGEPDDYYDKCMRHLEAYRVRGEAVDAESGVHHLAKAVADLLIMLERALAVNVKVDGILALHDHTEERLRESWKLPDGWRVHDQRELPASCEICWHEPATIVVGRAVDTRWDWEFPDDGPRALCEAHVQAAAPVPT